MIELQHLTKRFATQGGTVVALNDINLTIRDGDVYGIIGMSGAGKSTLVRCINMLERPDEGNVIVNGKQMQDLRAADLRDDELGLVLRIGIVSGRPDVAGLH